MQNGARGAGPQAFTRPVTLHTYPPPTGTQACLLLGLYVCICNSLSCVSRGLAWQLKDGAEDGGASRRRVRGDRRGKRWPLVPATLEGPPTASLTRSRSPSTGPTCPVNQRGLSSAPARFQVVDQPSKTVCKLRQSVFLLRYGNMTFFVIQTQNPL